MQETPAAPETPIAQTTEALVMPAWTPEPIARAWEAVESFPLLGAAVIVVLGYLAAKVVDFLFTRGLTRATRKTETDLDDQIVALLHRPFFLAVFFAALALALKSLALPVGLTSLAIRILKTLVVLVWMRAGFRVSRLFLEALARHRERFPVVEERTIPLFDILMKLVILGIASYLGLMIWRIDPTGWLAATGVVGVAVGFAAKDTLANLFGGFFILADGPYKLGDYVVLDSGERGKVTHVGIRSTRLLSRDDIEITLPNAVMANAKIVNESGGPWKMERIRVKVGVAYGSDVDQVVEVLERVAGESHGVAKKPVPRVRMRGFGDSSLDFELLVWIAEPELRGKMLHELNMGVYKTFAAEGIEIPFPQRDVWIKQPSAQEASDA